MLQGKLEQPISNPPSPADFNQGDRANNLSSHIQHLRDEVSRFREQLTSAQEERKYFLILDALCIIKKYTLRGTGAVCLLLLQSIIPPDSWPQLISVVIDWWQVRWEW